MSRWQVDHLARRVEAASSAGKDVFAFVVNESHPWAAAEEQDLLAQADVRADPARVQEVLAALDGLQRFKLWLADRLVVERFTTPEDAVTKVTGALAAWAIEEHTRGPSEAAPTSAERPLDFRVHHPLQPAPYFQGRSALVDDLIQWWSDPAHPDRVRALVAAGGTGKTAVVEQLLRRTRALELRGHVLVWSFYETPDADAFLRVACDVFLGEREGPAGGRLERLERGLREGNRLHLLVLDGLGTTPGGSPRGQRPGRDRGPQPANARAVDRRGAGADAGPCDLAFAAVGSR